jgi:hypothetical protein
MNIYAPITITEEIERKFKPTRLAVKELNGIKYLCKSSGPDFVKYTGSGVHWKQIVKKHGKKNVKTLWISDWFHCPYHLQEFALMYSEYNQIVESTEWANLIAENGLWGGGRRNNNKGRKYTPEQKTIHSLSLLRGKDHPGFDATEYEWVNQKTGEKVRMTRQDFIQYAKVSAGNIVAHMRGERRCVSDWVMTEAKKYRGAKIPNTKGSKSPRYDHTQYSWKNLTTGEVIVMTRFDFTKKYNTSSGFVCDHIHGKKKSCKGWAIIR